MDASKLMGLMKDKKAAMTKRDRTVKPHDGKNRIVLLPGWEAGNEHVYFHDFGQHYIKNAAGEIQAVYPCADSTYGQPCAVCAALSDATRNAPDDATISLLGEAKASRRVLLNVLVLDGDKPNEPVIYEVAPTVFGAIVDLIEEWGIEAFKREIVIERSGKGLNTKYTAQISPKTVEVAPATLAKIHNLAEYVKQESEEQQRRAISAIGAVSGHLPAPTGGHAALTSRPSSATAGDAIEGAASRVASAEGAAAGAGSTDLDDLLAELPE